MNLANFFDYRSHYRTGIYYELNTIEWLLPIALIIMIAVLMIVYREKLRGNSRLDKNIRLYGGIFFMIIYLSHYALRFALYGFDYLLLPFQLCSISMFFAIVLIFTKNKTIFNFVLYTGVLGGFISIFVPIIGYDSSFYRYYQYEFAHGLLILTPIYFLVVHDYIPSKMETVYSFLILQGIGVFMVIFNYYAGTDYMFIFVNPDKVEKFPMIAKFGGIPLYLLWVEIAGITAYFIEFQVIHFFYKSKKVKEEIIL
jgi:hypothetical integral membrane protein (TIGR02206 family)